MQSGGETEIMHDDATGLLFFNLLIWTTEIQGFLEII
jgi:hypothetical protein